MKIKCEVTTEIDGTKATKSAEVLFDEYFGDEMNEKLVEDRIEKIFAGIKISKPKK